MAITQIQPHVQGLSRADDRNNSHELLIPWAVIWGRSYLGNGTDHPRDLTITLTKLPGKQDSYI